MHLLYMLLHHLNCPGCRELHVLQVHALCWCWQAVPQVAQGDPNSLQHACQAALLLHRADQVL
jgi:hypothetical protein